MSRRPAVRPSSARDDAGREASTDGFAATVLDWYAREARDLPWRRPGAGPWAILVSEFMLQQTPVARVLPAYAAWLQRWPNPAALASASPGEAVRMWGRLGYPRRALRLRDTAVAVVDRHGGMVPSDLDALLALPGVGDYTARAVASFAFAQRHPVVDTNVRRVVARSISGQAEPGRPSTRRDLETVAELLPADAARAARFGVALMELGALVCTARSPTCARCPLTDRCAWVQAGRPPWTGPVARPQRFAGTDRQVRGLLLERLRASDRAVAAAELDLLWPEPVQRQRALDTLVADGLVEPLVDGRFALPR